MVLLHTADWHIGQLFHEYDHTYEHQQFLNWLLERLVSEHIDVLLISGDVFDLSNPSAASIKMFYRFLNQSVKGNPDLQIIITAGNHDSAARLESPKPLLESSNIHVSGGESFLASLGPASLSSSRMQVESLFINEGFGSLDPATLNIAMDALGRLHHQRRTMGVVSHMQEMTERIPVQIKVSKQQSGRGKVNIISQ